MRKNFVNRFFQKLNLYDKIITEELDIISDLIIEWILSLGYEVERRNVETFHDFTFEINNLSINGVFENAFHRRAKLNILPTNLNTFNYKDELKNDNNLILKAHEKIAKNIGNYVGEFNDEEQHNKVLDLYYAIQAGFNIPDTLITNTKSKLLDFVSKNGGKVITKSIKNPLLVKEKNYTVYGRETLLIESKEIDFLNEYFNAGLFQRFIEKVYELRVFVYKDRLYSMAIFPHDINEIDFRITTDDRPKDMFLSICLSLLKRKLKHFLELKISIQVQLT